MRLLLISDLHYALPQFDWVVAASPSFDVVAVAGDSLSLNSVVPLDAQSVVVHRYLTMLAAQTTLVVSSGNHDLTALAQAENRRAVPSVIAGIIHTSVGNPMLRGELLEN